MEAIRKFGTSPESRGASGYTVTRPDGGGQWFMSCSKAAEFITSQGWVNADDDWRRCEADSCDGVLSRDDMTAKRRVCADCR